jgi:serine/threonine-protein kinase 24/25/MST4
LGITAIELAKGEPPNSELHPMRVLFLIPKNNPPQLTGNYSKQFKEFVEACLNKDPENRPTAKELLKYPFIKKAKKNGYLIDLIERFKRWKSQGNHGSDSESDGSDSDSSKGDSSTDDSWIHTVTAPPPEMLLIASKMSQNGKPPTSSSIMHTQHDNNIFYKPRPASVAPPPPFIGEPPENKWDSEKKKSPPRSRSPPGAIPAPQKSPNCLSTVIHPLITEMERKHQNNSRSSELSHRNGAMSELRDAFDTAERSCPGITNTFVKEIFHRLMPNMNGTRLQDAMDKVNKDVS